MVKRRSREQIGNDHSAEYTGITHRRLTKGFNGIRWEIKDRCAQTSLYDLWFVACFVTGPRVLRHQQICALGDLSRSSAVICLALSGPAYAEQYAFAGFLRIAFHCLLAYIQCFWLLPRGEANFLRTIMG